jgi:hypothetical protein
LVSLGFSFAIPPITRLNVSSSTSAPRRRAKRGPHHKMMVVSLVKHNGSVRSFHITDFDGTAIRDILDKNISREAHLRTDESERI